MTRPVNIAAIVPYPIYPAKMGGQKGIALFYQYLSKVVPVTIITARQQAGFEGKFLPVLGHSRLRYINPALLGRLKKIISKEQISHLVLEHPYFGWLAVMLKRSCSIPLIIHSHNIESLRFKSTGKWWWKILWNYEKFTHRQADCNFFITDEDRKYAIENFQLEPAKCHTVTYGFEMNSYPPSEEKTAARLQIENTYGINPDEKILFFNGTLAYKPNLDAVNVILQNINPLLLKEPGFYYKIIICGKGLPAEYDELKKYRSVNIIYAGFVDDISIYFKAADIFLNPITDGGGIKTKLVESLGYNVSSVTTVSGAIGVPEQITGAKMKIVADDDWAGYTQQVLTINTKENIPQAFFNHFYWGNIVQKAAAAIQQTV